MNLSIAYDALEDGTTSTLDCFQQALELASTGEHLQAALRYLAGGRRHRPHRARAGRCRQGRRRVLHGER
jgi:hypothetical protein